MKIIEFQAPAKVNPFAADIAELVKQTATNPKAAGAFECTVEDEGKTRYNISKAANDLDKTASLVNADLSKDGKTVTLVFTIKPRHKSGPRIRRGGTVGTANVVDGAAE